MNISFLLSQLLINKTVGNDIVKNTGKKQNNDKPLPDSKISNAPADTSSIASDYRPTQKNESKPVTPDFPVIYDTVEISKEAMDYNAAAASGYSPAISETTPGATMQGGSSKDTKDRDAKDSGSVSAIVLSVGIVLTVTGLFFLPEGLLLTIAGILTSIYGVRICFK